MILTIFSILDIAIIGGGAIGFLGMLFPELLFKFANPVSEKIYNRKDAIRYRIFGALILIIAILFYVVDN